MKSDYDSILMAIDSNVVNRTEFYAVGKGMPDHGIAMAARSYTLSGDMTILSILVFMFFLSSFFIYRARLLFAFRLKTFFTSKRIYSDENVNGNRTESIGVFLLTCVGALSASVLNYYCMSEYISFPSYYDRPYWIIGIGALLFLLYIYIRAIVYNIVNWVFFDIDSRTKWNSGFFLIIIITSFIWFTLTVVAVFTQIEAKSVILCCLFAFFLHEILLLYKLIVNFTSKIYGVLLIFLYFCSVELMPFALLWYFFEWVFNSNFVNNLLT
ncbi:MAG: DUF4271 domain-containing protein [Bacteroidaceae bacterium]|nr:DUF4271 domain-containing protein [Bacteroidaceae bacterium]